MSPHHGLAGPNVWVSKLTNVPRAVANHVQSIQALGRWDTVVMECDTFGFLQYGSAWQSAAEVSTAQQAADEASKAFCEVERRLVHCIAQAQDRNCRNCGFPPGFQPQHFSSASPESIACFPFPKANETESLGPCGLDSVNVRVDLSICFF